MANQGNKSRSVVYIVIFLLQVIISNAHAVDKDIASPSIDSAEDFARLSAAPESSTLARTETVKFMVDRKAKRKLWFFNTEKYTYHHAFARDHLSSSFRPVPSHDVFNLREYSHKNRRFEMGSIIYYKDQGYWVMQLMAGDTLTPGEISVLFHQVKNALWIGKDLRFLPMSVEQENVIKSLSSSLPFVSVEDVFKGIRYQPLTSGRAVGYLRIVKGTLDPATVRSNQILVLEKLPEEIPVSAAVISQQLQAPLAHIALLCGSRGTPNMGLRDALSNNAIQALDGQLVELNITPQEYSLAPTTLDIARIFWDALRPIKPLIPKANLNEKRLLDVSELKLANVIFAGAKAAQLGEVEKVRPALTTPGGFVVPLAYYFEHLHQMGVSPLVDRVLSEKNSSSSTQNRYADLDHLRAAIETAPINADLINAVKIKMSQSGHNGRWIFRSSTNAEDLAGFNGAGLYRSIKIKAGATDVELIDALRKVWASVWLQAAYDERAWYGVDHGAVGMAVLVQPYVEGAIANGVAITANPFAEFRPGLLINTEPRGGSVTGAEGNEVPEQHLVYTFGEQLEFELLSKSSRMREQKIVLGKETLRDLSNQLIRLHKHFLSRWNSESNAVDIEFLVMQDQKIVVLQARPYRVTYRKEQRM